MHPINQPEGAAASRPFVHCHCHSSFSFKDGVGLPHQVADRLQVLGHTACALTDHGSSFGHVSFYREFEKRGLHFIPGVEFYVVEDVRERTKAQKSLGANAIPHVTVLAATQKGYENLLTLTRISWEHFYYFPRIDAELLTRYQEGLVVLSGCVGGWPTRHLLANGEEGAAAHLLQMRQRIERYYVELNPCPGLDKSELTIGALDRLAHDLGIPTVLTADAHFPRPEDHLVEDVMLAVGIGKRLDDPERTFKLPEWLYYCSREEILARAAACDPKVPASRWEEAADRTVTIAAQCQVELPKAGRVAFYGLKPGESAAYRLNQDFLAGLDRRLAEGALAPVDRPRYVERALHEYETLCKKGFADYLLAIADVVRHAKSEGQLVMCRGSAGGCLLLWLLGASETDPLRHGLSFERFYDASRPDPPDVDLDFEQARRPEAIAYVRQQYGPEKTAQLAALSQMKAKSAVNDVAFAYGISKGEVAPLTAVLSSADEDVEAQLAHVRDPRALAVLQAHPELALADRLIGQYRQASIHAAGVLISDQPIERCVGLVRGKDHQTVAAVDKRQAAYLGFLKMDFLAVRGLDIVAAAVRQLRQPMSWLSTLPLDDAAALAVAREGRLAGVFQLDGPAAARVAREIGIDTFADVVAASALCRPGPAEWVETYQRHKQHPDLFARYLDAMHPTAREIVRETFGILLYQEQVMAFARQLAGFEWAEVHRLRKGIGDKLGANPQSGAAWSEEWSAKFIAGCTGRGVEREEAEFWWHSLASHGGYSFNKSHCVTYALIGYWMLSLKAHHPDAFYHAYLSLETDAVTMKRLIREFAGAGGQVRLLDPACSGTTFVSPRPGVLVGGFMQLRGVGPKTAARLVAEAPFADWDALAAALPKRTRALLDRSGASAFYRDGRPEWDSQLLTILAPWFPVPDLPAVVRALRQRQGLPAIAALDASGDRGLLGYVTATRFDAGHVLWCLEDETGTCVCRVARRDLPLLGPVCREIQVGDLLYTWGWWSGDALYVKGYSPIAPCQELVPAPEPGSLPIPPVPVEGKES